MKVFVRFRPQCRTKTYSGTTCIVSLAGYFIFSLLCSLSLLLGSSLLVSPTLEALGRNNTFILCLLLWKKLIAFFKALKTSMACESFPSLSLLLGSSLLVAPILEALGRNNTFIFMFTFMENTNCTFLKATGFFATRSQTGIKKHAWLFFLFFGTIASKKKRNPWMVNNYIPLE